MDLIYGGIAIATVGIMAFIWWGVWMVCHSLDRIAAALEDRDG